MSKKTIRKPQDTLTILKTKITVTPKDQLLNEISSELKINSKMFLTTPNPEILVMANKSDVYRQIINNSDIAIPDGVGITAAARLLYGKDIKRIRGRELFLDLLKVSNDFGYKMYLLGARDYVNKAAIKKINRLYPKIIVKGSADIEVDINANFEIENSANEYFEIINSINKFKPHILIVFLGAPKQEVWIAKYLSKLNVKLMAALGGSLDYFVGETHLPPCVVSKLGLEWIWRLFFQPSRIKRIFNAVIVFPILVLAEKLTTRNS